jgi:16S rRNA (adenine1518-N6/adenine1519-N6)-dimethyltransferase
VIEIGPGLGILTRSLCQAAGFVLAIEFDTTLFGMLQKELEGFSNLLLVQADALTFDFGAWARERGVGGKAKVVANLPYYISTPLLFRLLRYRDLCSLLVLMVQKEVGERILAEPGSKQYGSLSIALQLYAEPKVWIHAPREAFYPSPQVDSVVLKVLIREKPRVEIGNEPLFRSVVRAAFAQRRKMLGNSLSGQLCPGMRKEVWDRVFQDAAISQKRRGETLSIEEFAELTHHLNTWLEREGYVPHRQG